FCLKVETHNSPSALDPYGGALTGILGVNRDILGCGIGAQPIANTDVLCFAPVNYSDKILDQLPKKLKHPKSILRGVHRGIEDGGNKSGIPTVNGAIQFHDNYAGKPLVYCGTVGVLPQSINGFPTHLKRQTPGDLIVVCGGSVGADGIHGATFSSLELNDDAPSTAVQIGDPLTQKRLTDFLIEARDLDLYNSLTDNGAGGLSSSVGEMAEATNGASVYIDKIPLKYPGLSAFEIIISESQERMTFSVPKEKVETFIALAEKRNCNPAIIGEFHDKGSFDIYQNKTLLASLDMHFLHDSLIPMELTAKFEGIVNEKIWHTENQQNDFKNLNEKVLFLIQHANIKSKEALVKQFDHEVKASTVVKPFIQKKLTGPSDGAVLWTGLYGGSKDGAICISSGMAPQVSHLDTYAMTQFSIDEAVRNAVSCGANPSFISVCDNYCWPDPIKSLNTPDGEHKLAQLVRSTKALYDTAMVYGTPFISGKDSMKNDFIGETKTGDKLKISVPPTLLITAVAKLDHIDHFMTTDFKQEKDLVYYLGPIDFEQTYYSTLHPDLQQLPEIKLKENKLRYELLHKLISNKMINSSHDISEGGIITSVIESLFPQKLGFNFESSALAPNESIEAFLFNEIPGGFILSVSPEARNKFETLTQNQARFLGVINTSETITYDNQLNLNINELHKLWSRDEY
ncbi:MAG: phosphoribosylformylglycinamidine synthase, partial [Halobacteriovoraceae bacterium]|nr:phosphoribosylformylglycinamidine synthase [Halobacteriovoraceae bacterium]